MIGRLCHVGRCGARRAGNWSARWSRQVRSVPARFGSHRRAGAPAVAPLRYRGTRLAVSRAAHPAARPVSASVTVALAGLAALITNGWASWRTSAATSPRPRRSDQLAVVQVQAGETLQQLAGRVAPDAPAAQVAQRIRELNKLDSAALDAGQTLIAPLG